METIHWSQTPPERRLAAVCTTAKASCGNAAALFLLTSPCLASRHVWGRQAVRASELVDGHAELAVSPAVQAIDTLGMFTGRASDPLSSDRQLLLRAARDLAVGGGVADPLTLPELIGVPLAPGQWSRLQNALRLAAGREVWHEGHEGIVARDLGAPRHAVPAGR